MNNEIDMLKRIIPSSGEELPVIGMGTWQTMDVELSNGNRENLSRVLEVMHNSGGRLIDTSPMYGRAETVIGELTGTMEKRNDFFYATKVWTNGAREGVKQMEASLKKMKREKMDLIQVHNLMDYKNHLKTLRQWKEEGKVRYIGVTHYTVAAHEELATIIRTEKIDFVQFNYSIKVRNAENGLLKKAREKGIAVIINEPFEKGDLFRIVKGKPLPEWCAEYEIENWAQFFLKYILANEAVTCVIPATSGAEHAGLNMGAGVGMLPDEKARQRMVQYMKDI